MKPVPSPIASSKPLPVSTSPMQSLAAPGCWHSSGKLTRRWSVFVKASAFLSTRRRTALSQDMSGPTPALGHASLALGWLDEAQRLGRRSVKSALSFNAHGLNLLGYIAIHPERSDPGSGEAVRVVCAARWSRPADRKS